MQVYTGHDILVSPQDPQSLVPAEKAALLSGVSAGCPKFEVCAEHDQFYRSIHIF
jgi:hypothetical protein